MLTVYGENDTAYNLSILDFKSSIIICSRRFIRLIIYPYWILNENVFYDMIFE